MDDNYVGKGIQQEPLSDQTHVFSGHDAEESTTEQAVNKAVKKPGDTVDIKGPVKKYDDDVGPKLV